MIKLEKKKLQKKTVKDLPETPGVYVFWSGEKPLYIGKAVNIKKRVQTYLASNLSPKTKKMIEEAAEVSFIEVTSELEALLLEANLINKEKPRYNVELKDDKHPLYIKITDEKYPRVLTARKKDKSDKNIAFFGPFPSSGNVRSVLRLLRKVFPFSTHKPSKKRCLYSQMGLCNPCPSVIEKTRSKKERKILRNEYQKNINGIKGVLEGRIRSVRNELEKKMVGLSEKKEFEEAAEVRDKIEKLDYITQPIIPIGRFVENPNLATDIREEEMGELRDLLKKEVELPNKLTRIECYDVSHISGVHATASMATFINGEPDKSLYRHFRIKQDKGADDISSMKEVAKRRIKHLANWGSPDLILVDGGKTQVSAFLKVFEDENIPIIGIAKRTESLVIPTKDGFKKFKLKNGPAKNLIQRLRDEAHRFARRYHHKLLQKSLVPSG